MPQQSRSWSDVFGDYEENFLPDLSKKVQTKIGDKIIEGYELYNNPVGYVKKAATNAGQSIVNTGNALYDLGVGVGSKALDNAGYPTTGDVKYHREQPLDNTLDYLSDKYFTQEGWKHNISEEPVDTTLDVLALGAGAYGAGRLGYRALTSPLMQRFYADESGAIKLNMRPFYGEDVGPKGRIANPEQKLKDLSLYGGLAGAPKKGYFNSATSALLQEGVQPRQTVTYYKKQLGSRGGRLPDGYWEAIMKHYGWGPDDVVDRDMLVQMIDETTPPLSIRDYYKADSNQNNYKDNKFRLSTGLPRYEGHSNRLIGEAPSDYAETILGFPTPEMQGGLDLYGLQINNFTDTHYPKEENLLGWLRTKDAQDTTSFPWDDGRLIEEIQPQRYQKGRDKGFAADPQTVNALKAKHDALVVQLQSKAKEIQEQTYSAPDANDEYWYPYKRYKEHLPQKLRQPLKLEGLTPEERKAVDYFATQPHQAYGTLTQKKSFEFGDELVRNPEYQKLNQEIEEIVKEQKQATSGVAQSPYTNNPIDASKIFVKHALNQAAHGDKNWLAWTHGEDQADRYNQLLKDVTKIVYNEAEDRLSFYDKSGDVLGGHYLEMGQTLADVIGKDAASKVLAAPKKVNNRIAEFPEGMTIGGEGMKAFYGSGPSGEGGQISDQIASIIEQISGQRPTIKPKQIRAEKRSQERMLNYPSVELTPEVRELIKRIGLPIFGTAPVIADQVFDTDENGYGQ